MLANLGFLVLGSIAMAKKVLTKETASVPASWALKAISVMSVTLGESLVIIGRVLFFFTSLTTE